MAQLNYKKIFALGVIAIIFAIIGWELPLNTMTNQTVGLNIVVNNTNLAPTIEPSVPGTGERINGVTYYNNNSDIEIFLYAHANTANQTSDISLYINGTVVSAVSSKPVGAAPEQNNKSIVAIIPRYASYKAIFANYHHYEWREYQILSGNFTSNISGTGTATCVNCINETQLNENMSLKVNKSGDTMTGNLNVDGYGLITSVSHVHLESSPTPLVRIGVESSHNSYLEVFQDSIYFSFINGTSKFYSLTKSGLDMNNSNITNANNINSVHLIAQYSSQGSLPLFIDNPEDGSPTGVASSKYLAQFASTNSTASATFHTRSLNPNSMFNVFSAISTNGSLTNWYGLPANQNIFFIGARGSTPAENGSTVSSRASIILSTGSAQWTNTSTPTKILFQTTALNSTSRGTAVTIDETKNVTVAGLAGVGNAYACLDSNGKLYRGSPGC